MEMTVNDNAAAAVPAERPRDRFRWLIMVELGSLDVFERVNVGLPEYSARKKAIFLELQTFLDRFEALPESLRKQITREMSRK